MLSSAAHGSTDVACPARSPRRSASARWPLAGASFDILTADRADLRRASLYIGLILLLTVGPFAVLIFGLLSQGQDLLQMFNGTFEFASGLPDDVASLVGLAVTVTVFLALAGYVVVLVEGQAVAIVLLAGRLAHRPIPLRVAVARSRVVFWRLVRGALIVGVPIEVVELIVQYPITKGLSEGSQGADAPGDGRRHAGRVAVRIPRYGHRAG